MEDSLISEAVYVKGFLDYVDLEQVKGWCTYTKTDTPAVVSLYRNDQKVATTLANLPRPDVYLKGIHSTGACGFRFDVAEPPVLKEGDTVSVKAIVNKMEIEINNSPKILTLNQPSRNASLSRQEKVFININTKGYGLEIGPSMRPLAPKSLGYNCKVLDHLDAEGLRKKYANDKSVDISKIEKVDYVWNGEPLAELVGERNCFDYIIASHVIEHTPDLLGFLQQCASLLKDTGTLSLVIPDKRYCFDYFRWPSTTGDVLQAYFEKRTLHTPGVIFDQVSSACKNKGQITWSKNTIGSFNLINTLKSAITLMEKALTQADYIDIHNWRFTPSSFRLILSDLFAIGKIRLKESSFYDTVGCEFYMSLQFDNKSLDTTTVDRLSLLKQSMLEIRESIDSL